MNANGDELEAGLRATFERVAGGDTEAFGELYDALATVSYSACDRVSQTDRDRLMHMTWLFIWVNAASLSALKQPVQDLVLAVAHELGAVSARNGATVSNSPLVAPRTSERALARRRS